MESPILFDANTFSNAPSWGGALVVGIIEFVFIVVMATTLEIVTIVALVDKILNIFKNKE